MGNDSLISKPQTKPLRGEIEIPSDKSISHRSIIFGSLCDEPLTIRNFSYGADCRATLKIMEQLGTKVEFIDDKTLKIYPPKELIAPKEVLDCGNSGTSMRLLSGLLAALKFNSTLIGDASLSKRPMKRVTEPLEAMGAKINSNNNCAPLEITGSNLNGIEYSSEIASAQVKSCLILAGLNSSGTTTTYEQELSRDHSERMLKYLGATIQTGRDEKGFFVKTSKSKLKSQDLTIAGDISSATFFMIMAALVPESEIVIKNVGVNQTRTGILDVFDMMNVNYELLNQKLICNEEVADIRVKYSKNLKGCTISKDLIPRLIDEIPAIAILALKAQGETIIKDAKDLRNKESDRISCVVNGLKKIGANIEEKEDGFIIKDGGDLNGDATLDTHHDHRLAMSFFIAGLICEKPVTINDFSWVNTSFPEFLNLFKEISN